MRGYARESLGFLKSHVISRLLTADHRSEIVAAVHADLAENLSDLRSNLRSNYSPSWGTPEDTFAQFFTYTQEVLELFPRDATVASIVEGQTESANENIDDLHTANADREAIGAGPVVRNFAVADLPDRDDDVGERDVFSDIADSV
jgi:hypothetical protein